jgi:hypothetical protein
VRIRARLLRCLLVLVLAAESAGAARAFGRAATVDCCCGAHAVARPCACRSCPVGARRVRRGRPVGDGRDHLRPVRPCGGDGADPGRLAMPALAVGPPSLQTPRAAPPVCFGPPASPRGRRPDAARPPP